MSIIGAVIGAELRAVGIGNRKSPSSKGSAAGTTATVQNTTSSPAGSTSATASSTTTATTATASATLASPVGTVTATVSTGAGVTVGAGGLLASSAASPAAPPVDRDRKYALATQARAVANAPVSALSDVLSGASDDPAAQALESSEKKFFATVSAIHTLSAQAPADAGGGQTGGNSNAALTQPYTEFDADSSTPNAQAA